MFLPFQIGRNAQVRKVCQLFLLYLRAEGTLVGPLKFCSRGAVRMSDEKKGAGGRPAALVEGGKSTQLYFCEACPAKVKSFHLKKHYKDKTNFELLARLKDGEEVEGVDPHTRYMYEKGYSQSKLPSYFTHKMVSVVKRGPLDKLLGTTKGERDERAH